ncbi:MAG: hypothetical protein ACKVH9_03690 [Rhodobacterales bacterium]
MQPNICASSTLCNFPKLTPSLYKAFGAISPDGSDLKLSKKLRPAVLHLFNPIKASPLE